MISKASHSIKHVVFFVLWVCLCTPAGASEPVEFADANLKRAIERKLNLENPTQEDMLKLEFVGYYTWDYESNINNLKGLEYAKNLKCLNLVSSPIQDFSILSELHKLETLSFKNCNLSDISEIISFIKQHDELRRISFRNNQITDISLTQLDSSEIYRIDLSENPLNEDAYKNHIPELRKKYRGIEIAMPFRADQLIAPSIVFVIFIIIGLITIYRNWKEKGWIFELLTGLASAGVGCYFGLGAQILYTSGGEIPLFGNGYENPMWAGGVAGGVFGFLTGVWFVQYLRHHLVGGYSRAGIVGKGCLVGIMLGVICSTAVHALLMIAYRNLHFGPMLIGMAFGIGAGIITGLVVMSAVFVLSNKMGLIQIKE